MKIKYNKFWHLSQGLEVEVRDEEEGFTGSWYEGKIASQIPDSKGKISVMCRDFIGHSWSRTFHIASIRPLPPPPAPNQSYELLDVVDAFLFHGWWKGFVCKVDIFSSTQMYTVVLFENPPKPPPKLIFASHELRFHLVWTPGGKWVRSPKLKEIPNVAASEEQSDSTSSNSKEDFPFVPKKNLFEQSTPFMASSTNKKLKKSTPKTGETTNGLAEFAKKREREQDAQFTSQQAAAPGGKRRNLGNLYLSSTLNFQSEMPFKKSLSHWQYVDSLKVFRCFPQRPHFRPLLGCNEATREALALGHMMTFASLVEKASELKIDHPKGLYESYMDALSDLEKLGFEVKLVVDCINELLAFRRTQDELGNQFRGAVRKIASVREKFRAKTAALGRNLT